MKRALLAVTIAAAVLFTAFPGIDLAVSDLFYRPNGGFHLRDAWWAVTLYESVPVVAIVVGGGGALLLAHNLVRRRQTGPFSSRFLVNAGLKDHWGRARPRDVVEFGGEQRFTPALVPTDQCRRNCSFVAGHPSVVYWLAALGFAAASRRRRGQVFVAAAVLGLMAGFGRIVQGGHFLSDVVFSGIVVFAVIWVLAAWVFRLPAAEDAGIVSLPVVGDS